jgi:hypothetical protein
MGVIQRVRGMRASREECKRLSGYDEAMGGKRRTGISNCSHFV